MKRTVSVKRSSLPADFLPINPPVMLDNRGNVVFFPTPPFRTLTQLSFYSLTTMASLQVTAAHFPIWNRHRRCFGHRKRPNFIVHCREVRGCLSLSCCCSTVVATKLLSLGLFTRCADQSNSSCTNIHGWKMPNIFHLIKGVICF
ncbi:hypothetical protein PIB30_055440 [Stylosanthes scabra]|uniref:Uncharacterized protein n=1 Tax=Stylosanthes scabra TaxID=79078 RepID=A0ABU6TLI1_9FABA|nr:hypothetical protein [Stylosanthes scabra]